MSPLLGQKLETGLSRCNRHRYSWPIGEDEHSGSAAAITVTGPISQPRYACQASRMRRAKDTEKYSAVLILG